MDDDDEYEGAVRVGNEDGGEDDMEMNLSLRTTLASTIDQFPFDDYHHTDSERPRLGGGAGTGAPLGNVDAVRPEEQVINSTAYYNLVSLWAAIYVRTEQGFALPLVFDAATQQMVQTKRARFNF